MQLFANSYKTMNTIKTTGLLYIKKKTPKFQSGNAFGVFGQDFNDATLYQPKTLSSNPFENYKMPGLTGAQPKPTISNPTGYSPNPSFGMKYTAPGANALGSQMKPVMATPRITNTGFNPNPVKPTAAPIGGGMKMGKFDAAGAASAGASLLGMAGTALSATTDGNAATFTKKEKLGTIGGSMLSGASTGAMIGSFIPVPILGTVAGALAGALIGGIFGRGKANKAKKQAGTEKTAQDMAAAATASGKARQEAIDRDAMFAAGTPSTAAQQQPALSGYMSRKNGGSFHYTVKESTSFNRLKVIAPTAPKKFKRGGSITATENIIPNGVLHEEFNKLGDKGMPVVKCKNNSCEKKYEIERDEMIFTLATTKNVEKLVKSGDLKELGKYVRAQVLDNTHSFTEKFNDLNNYNKNKNESIFA
jgi:hypothetical protein